MSGIMDCFIEFINSIAQTEIFLYFIASLGIFGLVNIIFRIIY